MKAPLLFTTLAASVFLSGCLKETTLKTYTMYRPQYKLKEEVKAAAKLSEPRALKDPGSFALYGSRMFISEKNEGIHVIDYSNPAIPVNRGFIPIPGNTGLSLRNDVLYADCYTNLFVFRLGTGNEIQLENAIPDVFLARMGGRDAFPDVIETTWIARDTTVTDEFYQNHQELFYDGSENWAMLSSSSPAKGNNGNPGNTSVGSSMAVFAIVNDHLYTVDQSNLHAFSLQNALKPELKSRQHITWNVETIFPFKGRLFIGSMTGMFIYGVDDPAKPSYLSQFNHVRVCDPVIADDDFAFVTLRNGSNCGGFVNQLDVLDISTITEPVLVKSYPFSNPHGLSKDGNVLFVCDGYAGLKVLDAGDVNNLVTKHTLSIGKALDVVALGGLAFVMLDNAILIYSYDQQFNVQLMGSINKN